MTSFGRKVEEKTPLRRSRRGWKCDLEVGLKEIVCECVDWVCLSRGTDQSRALRLPDL